MLILNKQEALVLIDDLAELVALRGEVGRMSPEEAGAYRVGVQMLRSEFVKRLHDYL